MADNNILDTHTDYCCTSDRVVLAFTYCSQCVAYFFLSAAVVSFHNLGSLKVNLIQEKYTMVEILKNFQKVSQLLKLLLFFFFFFPAVTTLRAKIKPSLRLNPSSRSGILQSAVM